MAHQALLDISQDDRECARLLSILKFQIDYYSNVSAEIELAKKSVDKSRNNNQLAKLI
jgi:hypothetical protein